MGYAWCIRSTRHLTHVATCRPRQLQYAICIIILAQPWIPAIRNTRNQTQSDVRDFNDPALLAQTSTSASVRLLPSAAPPVRHHFEQTQHIL